MKPIAGGRGEAGQATARRAALPREAPRMGLITRLLEDEGVLGALLVTPAILLLFITYPFVKGV